MPGSTADEALNGFLETLRNSLNQVSASRLMFFENLHGKSPQLGHSYLLFHNKGKPVSLRGSMSVQLSVSHHVHVIYDPGDPENPNPEPYRVSTDKYLYHVSFGGNSADKPREVLAYHWNPQARAPERPYPHLHIGPIASGGSEFAPGRFHKLHLPTDRVALESVLIFLIEELDVKPVPGRSRTDALAALRTAQDEFYKQRTRY